MIVSIREELQNRDIRIVLRTGQPMQTCKANRIDPYRYLLALFTALPKAKTADDYEALLPWRIVLPAT